MKIHQSDDKIIVTELRPMSDVPTEEDCEILVKVKGTETLQATYIFEGKFIDHLCDQIYPERIEGWLPMPIFQPENKSQDKAALYEKLRKLNPREFAELHERNLRGDGNFDELVSQLP